MSVETRECPHCAAPLVPGSRQCSYCGTWMAESTDTSSAEGSAQVNRTFSWRLPPGAGEFGIRGWAPIAVGLAGATLLYALGWKFEDIRYWLDLKAALIWAGALPAWLLLVAFLWRPKRLGWPAGLAFAVTIFLLHLAIMFALRRRLNDDQVGIAALYAGAALAGWLLGRASHYLARRSRAGAGAKST
ncbi:MAG: zinc ribbon domain-containing protein [Anaerolineales bacterium]